MLANFGHPCTALLELFHALLHFLCGGLHTKTNSCNLNLPPPINCGAKGLTRN